MLVVTRREGEEIIIGSIKAPVAIIRVVAIRGERIRLGVEAPKNLTVDRREVAEARGTHDRTTQDRPEPASNHA